MKKNRLLAVLILFMVLLTGCSNKEVFVNENNEIKETSIEEIENKKDKCFVIVGKKDDKCTNSLSNHLQKAIKIENESIYLLYVDESQDKINILFSPQKIPTLYVVENNKILDSIEYYEEKDVEGMTAPEQTEYTNNLRQKITKFVEENKG